MMRCIIIDDEKLALDLLESNIARVPFLKLVERFNNPFQALSYLQDHIVDLVFMDIEMPKLTGLEMLGAIKGQPQIVIVSAYQQYAVAGFDMDVTDYLLKPVSFERFLKACLKCQQIHQQRKSLPQYADQSFFFVNVDYALVKIKCKDVIYIEAMRDYIKIVLKHEKPVVTRLSLKSVERRLNADEFVRIHKSFIVNTDSISSIRKGVLVAMSHELPLSDNYRDAVVRRLRITE